MKLLDFIFAARPMLLLPVWSIYLISFRYYRDAVSLQFDAYLVLFGATFLFAGAYYINQVYDYDSDLFNKKLGFLQKGLIGIGQMKAAYIIVSILGLAAGAVSGTIVFTALSVILLLGYIYSAPPVRLKDRPLAGLLANSVAYGIFLPLTVPGLKPEIFTSYLLLPLFMFLAVAAGYLLTIIPDREGDLASGKKTLAAFIPDRAIIALGVVFIVVSLVCAWNLDHYYLIGVSALSLGLFTVALIRPRPGVILFACKFPILLMSLLAGCYYPAYLVFLVALLIVTRLYYRRRFNLDYPRLS